MLPNLYRNRHGTYYLRITLNKREIKRSLRTKEPGRAKLAAHAFALARLMDMKKPFPYELPMGLDLAKLRELGVLLPSGAKITDIETEADARLVALMLKAIEAGASPEDVVASSASLPGISAEKRLASLMAAAPAAPGKSKPFSSVVKSYLTEKALDNSIKTQEDKKATYAAFQAMHGDQDFNAISADQALGWKQRLISEGLSANRINTKLSHLKDLFGWAQDNGLRHTGNPFQASRVSSKAKIKQRTESYEPFTQEELNRIFDPKGYPAFMAKPDYFWLPFLALHTGARIEELAGLRATDIKSQGGVSFFSIEKGKNANSIRKVPFHKTIEASGFPAYAHAALAAGKKNAAGEAMLFPHLTPGKNGYSKNCSRRFGQWLDKIGIVHRTKAFHSFRSTFITGLSDIHAHPAMVMALVGHYEQSKVDLSAPHFQNYQGSKLIPALKETIDRFEIKLPMQF